MTQTFVALFCSLVVLSSVEAVNYVLVPSDEPIQRCPGKENLFFDQFFDYSNLESEVVNEETTIVNGFATFIGDISSTEPVFFKLKASEYKAGQWRDSSFTMNRENICRTFFDENEIWYELVKGFPKDCPPKNGEKYEFHNRSLNIVSKNYSPGLEGTYRIEATFSNSQDEVCFVIEGEAIRQQSSIRKIY